MAKQKTVATIDINNGNTQQYQWIAKADQFQRNCGKKNIMEVHSQTFSTAYTLIYIYECGWHWWKEYFEMHLHIEDNESSLLLSIFCLNFIFHCHNGTSTFFCCLIWRFLNDISSLLTITSDRPELISFYIVHSTIHRDSEILCMPIDKLSTLPFSWHSYQCQSTFWQIKSIFPFHCS